MSVNKVILIGRLGQDPVLKYTPTGMAVCDFSIATSEKWKDKGGTMQEKTEWHNINAYGKLAELCSQYLAKGRELYVEGKLSTQTWEKEGVKHYKTVITIQNMNFIGDANKAGGNTQQGQYQTPVQDQNFSLDEIPF